MFYFWLFIIIILTIIEAMTINLVSIWFIASALVSLILSFLIDNFLIQFSVFVILGIILLFTTRDILKKFFNEKKEATNLDRIIGMEGVVIEDILKNKNGAVKVDGKVWTAYANKNIKKDAIVKIKKINGAKIEVDEM